MPTGFKGWAIWVAAQAALTFVLRLLIKLADNAVMGWGDDHIAAYFGIKSPTGDTVFEWGLPFTMAALILLAYHLIQRWPFSSRSARYQEREIGLLDTLWWVAEESAWGRWQRAQRTDWANEERRLHAASSFIRTTALNGELTIRGRLEKSVDYMAIDRDFWRSAYIDLQPNNASIWKTVIAPFGGVTIPDYDGLIVERTAVETLWPKREWRYDWRTILLRIKAKLKSEPLHMQEVDKKETEPTPTKSEAIITPDAETVVPPIVAPKPVVITPSPDAPEGWEKLYAVGDDGRSIWLRFLPDNKTYRADTLVLIIFGHKVLRGIPKVRVAAANAAVTKTIDNSPGRPFDENVLARNLLGSSLWTNVIGPAERDYSEGCIPQYLERVGLSQGGLYQLTEFGEAHARGLAYDLIRRAD